ncbi:class I SAM-dependent methyltransferase [Congzhengia minquanensis]|uniref:DUF4942 domain-containing protein n=1 Tax=Congzhengia minquanensis TaxID=2763657 RepID=A0A926DPA6_9FIRM|nr:DUF4942 domain-containing protein [Congzhengia minquanensis]MBC8540810.1 DUF4942 domain-containing protein [Congzhengia minquanensis]
MFNKDFYPTPEHLINKMLSGVNLKMIKTILEPSAGKGNIVDSIKKKEGLFSTYYNKITFDIDCVELDKNLQHILKGKNYRVVHNDFLTYETMKEYDLIIMNPPFSNGAKHLLRALKMQKRNGGAVICLLNAETLKNQCNNDRIILSRLLTEYGAEIEYISNAFIGAEQKTPVETALIKVKLPEVKRQSFIFDTLQKEQEQKEVEYTEENNQLVENDFLAAIVKQYQMEVEAGIKLIKEFYAMKPYIMAEFKKDEETGETKQTGGCILRLNLSNNWDGQYNTLNINSFIREVRGKYWKALFNNPKFIGQLTKNLRDDYYNKVEELKDYDFSLYNIYEVKIDMNNRIVKGIEEVIVKLFEKLSYEHSYSNECSKNIQYYNGWKTNKAYIINKKVIIPLNGYWGGFRPTNYKVIEELQEIEKCFNYLDGVLTDAVDLKGALQFAEECGETKGIQLKYFTVTFYKKGTCHITFSNDDLLKKFNVFGSQKKGWLPPTYGKKQYKDMTVEEKVVVKEFDGSESEYNKVIQNQQYYLFDGNSVLMLESDLQTTE